MSEEKRGETFVIKEGAGDGRSPAKTPLEFTTFLLGMASTAMIHLGLAPHPESGKAEVNLVLAHQSIELLSMLRAKTRGNLTAEEEKVFEGLLADLRLRYVEASRK